MFSSFQDRLGYSFKDVQLLQTALTHRSYYFENRAKASGHFERLEFLGDAVLDLVLSETLMTIHPEMNEGSLSKSRASLVNEIALSEIAREINLGQELRLGNSEEKERDKLRPRILASAFEAVIAAIYLDGGLEVVRQVIETHFCSRIESLGGEIEFASDFKSRLQELAQKRFHSVPEYRMTASEGPEHAKNFTFDVYVNDKKLGTGQGSSRKNAEQEAARDALTKENEL